MIIKIKMLLKKLLRMLIYSVIIILILLKACEDDIIEDYYIWRGWQTLYFEEPGQCDKVILDANYDNSDMIKFDNFTKDAYDIKIFTTTFGLSKEYWKGAYSWVSFRYKTFSTYCTEVDESKIAFPYSLMSPSWWPDELQKPFFKRINKPNRSNYKFFLCHAYTDTYRDYFFECFAVDNNSKHGYYWKTIRKDKVMDNESINND